MADIADKTMEKIFLVIIGLSLLIYGLVPQLAGFSTALSSVLGQSWSWVVTILFLAVIYYIVTSVLKKTKK